MHHLRDPIEWYAQKSRGNQKAFQYLKVCTMSVAALIPLLSSISSVTSGSLKLNCDFARPAHVRVAERIESLVTQEHAKWPPLKAKVEPFG